MEPRLIEGKGKPTGARETKKKVFRFLQAPPEEEHYPLVESPIEMGTIGEKGAKPPPDREEWGEDSPERVIFPPRTQQGASETPSSNSNKKSSSIRKSKFVGRPMETSPLVLLTWVGRKVNVRNVKKSLKELVFAVKDLLPEEGTFYSCCENFDTYFTGGLYPVLHMSTDTKIILDLLSSQNFVPKDAIGDTNTIEQAVYQEVASVVPPGGNKAGVSSVIAVAGFRSIEDTSPPDILLREWKAWTGSRGFMVDILRAGLSCINVKFYVKKEPRDDPSSFFYLVTTEVAIREPRDEGMFVDVLQRFRVERFLGYRTIYRTYNVS